MTKEIWLTIVVPLLHMTTVVAGMDHSRSCGMIPTGVRSSWEWGIAMYKSSAAVHDTQDVLKL
eukprot:9292330-Pyramimonas_sp.AAC.1